METVPLNPDRRRRRLTAALLIAACVLFGGGLVPEVGHAAPAEPTSPAAREPLFSLPVEADVSRGFDPPEQPWLAGHRGVDLVVGTGSQVRAAGAGTVAFAGVVVDRPLVSIEHPVGIRTTYEPIVPSVTPGMWVERGEVIGTLDQGNDHCPNSCLHWGARTGPKDYIDPMRLLRPPVIRLYPPQPW